MRVIVVVAAALVLAAAPRPAPPARPAAIERARWLAGCWELQRGQRGTVEMWMPPAGGMMLGASRTVVGGVVREFEHLRLTDQGGRLVYTAIPSGQAEASFTSTVVTDTAFVVENLQHDFPQRISYARRGADSAVARIEGPGPGGTTRGIAFAFRRVDCH